MEGKNKKQKSKAANSAHESSGGQESLQQQDFL
jgi:hypothetical protein